MIGIIDYGMGNVRSIQNMFSHIGVKSVITSDIEQIRIADKLVLPGVGSFDAGMKNICSTKLYEILNDQVLVLKKPVLGICLGMQLMTISSEEGNELGLGWFNAKTLRFSFPKESGLKIPHMGWNCVRPLSKASLFNGLDEEKTRFYFVHSYYVKCANEENVLAESFYGNNFTCAIVKDNIYGVQFHPEKSHKFGMALLKNFAEL